MRTFRGAPLPGVLLRALGLDLFAVLPVGLAGTLGVLATDDLGGSHAMAGLMVSAYFTLGSVSALLTGPVVDRMGWRSASAVGLILVGGSLTAPAFAHTTAILVLSSACGGAGAAFIQPATSALISNTLVPAQRSLAINLKMAAAPGAMLVAGLSMPLVAQFLGWRETYQLASMASGGALTLLAATKSPPAILRAPAHGPRQFSRDKLLREVWLVGSCVLLGALVPGVVVAFMIPALLDVGYSPPVAGAVFAALSAVTVLARVCIALLADHPLLNSFRSVAFLMATSGVGVSLMMWRHQAPVLAGGALAFVAGFGWIGQTFALAVRMSPSSPAAAAAAVQSGGMGGSALGPLLGAAAAEGFGLSTVWLLAALAAACGATLLFLRPPPPAAPRKADRSA